MNDELVTIDDITKAILSLSNEIRHFYESVKSSPSVVGKREKEIRAIVDHLLTKLEGALSVLALGKYDFAREEYYRIREQFHFSPILRVAEINRVRSAERAIRNIRSQI